MKPSFLTLRYAVLLAFGGVCSAAVAQDAAPLSEPLSEPAPNDPLTLEESIRIALHNHGQPDAARLQAQSARERITSARAARSPQVAGTLGYNYLNQRNGILIPIGGDGTGGFVTSNNSSLTTDIGVTQNIFDAGRTQQRIRQAQAQAQGTVGSFGSTRSSLAFLVAQSFYEQLRQQKFVEQFQGQVDLAEQQVEQIRAQIEEGVAARVDVLGVQVTLRQAQFDFVTARNNLATARVNFRNALGLDRGPELQLVESDSVAQIAGLISTPTPPESVAPDELPNLEVPELPPTSEILNVPPPDVPELEPLEEYLAQARRLRPDLVQAEAAVAQNEAALALTKIEQRPQVTASAGFNLDPRSTAERRFQLGLGLTVPIFNGGGRRADTRAAQDELEAGKTNLEQLEKDVAADVEASYTDISGQVERIANARILVEQAQINLATATERYRLQLGIVLDIVNAQTQLFNAQVSATQAVYDYEIARAALDRAVGRYAWADPGDTPPDDAPVIIPIELQPAPEESR